VTIHAVHGCVIVLDNLDRISLLNMLAAVIGRQGWLCLMFCIMDTHYHLLVVTPEPNLAEGMCLLNGSYAQWFNRRHGRKGHLFRERYRPKRVLDDAHLLLTIRYIALNPVEAKLAPTAGEYPWSSYPGAVGVTPCWPFIAREELLAHFSRGESGARLMQDFVEHGQSSTKPAT